MEVAKPKLNKAQKENMREAKAYAKKTNKAHKEHMAKRKKGLL